MYVCIYIQQASLAATLNAQVAAAFLSTSTTSSSAAQLSNPTSSTAFFDSAPSNASRPLFDSASSNANRPHLDGVPSNANRAHAPHAQVDENRTHSPPGPADGVSSHGNREHSLPRHFATLFDDHDNASSNAKRPHLDCVPSNDNRAHATLVDDNVTGLSSTAFSDRTEEEEEEEGEQHLRHTTNTANSVFPPGSEAPSNAIRPLFDNTTNPTNSVVPPGSEASAASLGVKFNDNDEEISRFPGNTAIIAGPSDTAPAGPHLTAYFLFDFFFARTTLFENQSACRARA